MRFLISAAAIAAALMLTVAAHAADAPFQVTLDASKPGAVIDRHIFGQFAEHLGSGIYGKKHGSEATFQHILAVFPRVRTHHERCPGGLTIDSRRVPSPLPDVRDSARWSGST